MSFKLAADPVFTPPIPEADMRPPSSTSTTPPGGAGTNLPRALAEGGANWYERVTLFLI